MIFNVLLGCDEGLLWNFMKRWINL